MEALPEAPQFITSEVQANWRLCFHIAVEDYHGPSVHPGTFGRHQLKRENIGYFRFGRHSAFFTTSEPDGLSVMARECRAGTWRSVNYRVFHIFPNVTVSHFRTDGAHWYVMVMQYVPVARDRHANARLVLSRTVCAQKNPYPLVRERLISPVTTPIRRALVRHYSKQVLKEDTVACEKLQAIAPQIKAAPILGARVVRRAGFEEAYAGAMRDPPAHAVESRDGARSAAD